MRTVHFDCPAREVGDPRLARLTRHWKARLEDFGPGGPQVVLVDEERGTILARLPDCNTAAVLGKLEAYGVWALQEGELLRFFLRPGMAFEDLDYAWGCLNDLL